MTREEAAKLLPIVQAFAEGREIQSRCINGDKSLWYDDDDFSFDYDLDYRIKPSPKYRPFKDAEECWQEMQKHQPFGWVKDKETGSLSVITELEKDPEVENGFLVWMTEANMTAAEMYGTSLFADGTPFGVKEEDV